MASLLRCFLFDDVSSILLRYFMTRACRCLGCGGRGHDDQTCEKREKATPLMGSKRRSVGTRESPRSINARDLWVYVLG